MASTITADNGVSSGSAGLKSSADSSGVLALATGTGTTAVTIDASQNVGIGTSSPSGKLHVYGSGQIGVIESSGNYATSGAGYVRWKDVNGNAAFVGFAGNANNFDIYNSLAGALTFSTNATERARIDSSGNLLVGTTTQAGNNNAIMALKKGGIAWQVGPIGANGNFVVLNNSDVGAYIANGGTSWTANSDERLKTTLTPFENAAEKVCTLRAGTGRYLTDDESVSRSFLIAQDVQKVLPEAVNVQSDEQGTLGLQYQDLIPLLTAAIQEQQALITTLTERITALEAK